MWPRRHNLPASIARLTAIAAATLVAASSAAAQAGRRVATTTVKNLQFGTLFPGIPQTVPPTDAIRAAEVTLQGPNAAQIAIFFLLPSSLNGPAGSRLPISFTSTSAGFSTGSIGTQVLFDPRVLYRPRLSSTGRGTIYLGGVASPAPSQRSGSYRATVIIFVVLTGA